MRKSLFLGLRPKISKEWAYSFQIRLKKLAWVKATNKAPIALQMRVPRQVAKMREFYGATLLPLLPSIYVFL